jgi:hypothetical protein
MKVSVRRRRWGCGFVCDRGGGGGLEPTSETKQQCVTKDGNNIYFLFFIYIYISILQFVEGVGWWGGTKTGTAKMTL